MVRVRNLLDELLQQRLDDIRSGIRPELEVAPLRERVGDQGERQRMTMREREDPGVLLAWNLAPREITPALLRGQVAQRQGSQPDLPAGILTPFRRRRVAGSEDNERIFRQLGQKDLTEPAIEWREQFIGVDQHDVALGPCLKRLEGGRGCLQTQCQPQSVGEGLRRGLHMAGIEMAGTRSAAARATNSRSSVDFPMPPGP